MDRAASPQEAHEAAPNPTILGLGASLQKSRTHSNCRSLRTVDFQLCSMPFSDGSNVG
jgi:hypothetical protein